MMKRLVVWTLLALSFTGSRTVYGQTVPVSYGRITLKVSELWSKRVQQDRMILDNHNVQGQIPATLTIHPFQQSSADAKEHGALAFRKYLATSDTATLPRPKRLYTEDAIPFLLFSLAKPGGKDAGYFTLYVFSLKDGYQPVMLQTNNLADFRKMQAEWQQIIQSAILK